MPLTPRPSPQEVASVFAVPLTDEDLAEALRVLRHDPNWHVRVLSSPIAVDLALVYRPMGPPSLTLRLKPLAEHPGPRTWHCVP